MPALFGMCLSRQELLQRVGSMAQVGELRSAELNDGLERGVRIVDVQTGTGFQFTVAVDRGLDIGSASYRGIPLAWRSPTTTVAPSFFEPEGRGWLRGFGGGLVTTCGLTYFGAPTLDEGQTLGMHGRISYAPASHLTYGGNWLGDEYEMCVRGDVREVSALGENLLLRRCISARLGESRLALDDTVTNEGSASTPHMLLYHISLGFPILSEDSELVSPSVRVTPRDDAAAMGLEQHRRFEPPTSHFREQVFYHQLQPDASGMAQAALVNRAFAQGQGLGVYVRWRLDELPYLVQWKMMGQGTYVCGLEPATNRVEGRAKERAEGHLIVLEPGESRHYGLEIGVLANCSEMNAFAEECSKQGQKRME